MSDLLKKIIDHGGHVDLYYATTLEEIRSQVVLFKYGGNYGVYNLGSCFFESPKFEKALKFFTRYMDPKQNAGMAWTMAQAEDKRFGVTIEGEEMIPYIQKSVRKHGWCETTIEELRTARPTHIRVVHLGD